MAIVDEVRAEAARQRLSVVALASRTGIARPTLSRKLRGDRPLSLRDLELLCDALQVPVWVIAQRADKQQQ